MPCVAMTPAMPTPHEGCCGAAASATIQPLPIHRSASESTVAPVSTSVYNRFWKFLFHHWNGSHSQLLENGSPVPRRRRRTMPGRLSACSEMRQHVSILHEIETEPTARGPRAMQATCANCRQRFFRNQGTGAKDGAIEYCSVDCRSSAQYRATVQQSIDCTAAFEDSATMSSTPTTSRL